MSGLLHDAIADLWHGGGPALSNEALARLANLTAEASARAIDCPSRRISARLFACSITVPPSGCSGRRHSMSTSGNVNGTRLSGVFGFKS